MSPTGSERAPIEATMRSSAVRTERSIALLRITVLAAVIDVALVTMWIAATGGPRSDFWALYLIVVVSVGLRFGRLGP